MVINQASTLACAFLKNSGADYPRRALIIARMMRVIISAAFS
jgi:hypothetical protein